MSPCATKAASHEALIERPAPVQGHNHTLRLTHGAVRPSESLHPAVKGVTTQPACRRTATLLLLLEPTAALVGKQLKLRLFNFPTLSRPRWLGLPAGWVALLPGSHLHAKCVFICFSALVLWKRKQLRFYSGARGRSITQLPRMSLGI